MEFLLFIYPFIRFAKLSFSKFVKITFRAELKLVANFRTIVFTVPVTTVKGFFIALFQLFSVKDFVKIEQFCFVHQKAELYRCPAYSILDTLEQYLECRRAWSKPSKK